MRVGWIGAGRMGGPMAMRAARAGHSVCVYAKELFDESSLRGAGVRIAPTAADAVSDAELVCLCVFDENQAREAMLGPAGALQHMAAGAVLAVHTSGSSSMIEEIVVAAGGRIRILDAPFSGHEAGELTMLAGGEPTDLQRVQGVFTAYASKIFHVGAIGAAQRVKLVNQFLFRANVAAADLALRILESYGGNRAELVTALMACSGNSFGLATFASGKPIEEAVRIFQPYLDVYLPAARRDGLPIDKLLQRGEPDAEA